MSRHTETLTFNNFSGYYGEIPQGYGGFDWTDIDYFNNTKYGEPDGNAEGFQNTIKGRGEAGFGGDWGGSFETANLSETFSLKSMLADSGADSGVPIFFTSFTYSDGELKQKARDVVYITPGVQKIDFAKLGGKGDFQNIAAVYMSAGSAKYGAGYGHHPIGNGMVFDNMKVQWNGSIPDGQFQTARMHIPPHQVAQTLSASPYGISPAHLESLISSRMECRYHSILNSMDAALGHTPQHEGLTLLFALPEVEHFGT